MDRYVLDSKIGEGSYGVVYKIICGKKKYALKVEKGKNTLRNEVSVLLALVHPHIPRLLDYGITTQCSYIVIPLFRMSLHQLALHSPGFFTHQAVSKISLELLGVLKYIHSRGFIYRDIKPENMMIGYDKKVHLIDFGITTRIPKTGEETRASSFVGTLRYASINTHDGLVQNRRDDLESLCYALLFLLKGSLPWQGAEETGEMAVGEIKKAATEEMLCMGLCGSRHWISYLKHVKSLRFAEIPDYDFLRECLFLTGIGPAAGLVIRKDRTSKLSLFMHMLKRLFCC